MLIDDQLTIFFPMKTILAVKKKQQSSDQGCIFYISPTPTIGKEGGGVDIRPQSPHARRVAGEEGRRGDKLHVHRATARHLWAWWGMNIYALIPTPQYCRDAGTVASSSSVIHRALAKVPIEPHIEIRVYKARPRRGFFFRVN